MWIKAKTRFNHHAPGDVFEAADADGTKWIKSGLAEKSSEPKEEASAPKGKALGGPSVDKTAKGGAEK